MVFDKTGTLTTNSNNELVYEGTELTIEERFLIKELAEKSFLRVHRSFIVNTTKVTAFTPHDIEIGEVEIPIGVSYKGKVLEILGKV